MIGILGRLEIKDPKKDIGGAILPNGRVLANPTWIWNPANPESKPDPEGFRKKVEDYLQMIRDDLQRWQGEQTIRTEDLITRMGDRLGGVIYDPLCVMYVHADKKEPSHTGPVHPIAEAKKLIKEAGLR